MGRSPFSRLRLARGLATRHSAPRGESGAAAVEFALIAILLLTIVLAIIQFSIYFWSFQVAEHASREGARAYATDPCTSQITLITDRVGPASAGNLAITPGALAGVEAGDEVTVTVAFDVHRLDGGFLPGLPARVSQEATARIEDVEDC